MFTYLCSFKPMISVLRRRQNYQDLQRRRGSHGRIQPDSLEARGREEKAILVILGKFYCPYFHSCAKIKMKFFQKCFLYVHMRARLKMVLKIGLSSKRNIEVFIK